MLRKEKVFKEIYIADNEITNTQQIFPTYEKAKEFLGSAKGKIYKRVYTETTYEKIGDEKWREVL